MTLDLLYNTKAEVLKCRNTAALWLTVIGAAFIPVINLIKCLAKPDYFVPILKADPWKVFLEHNWMIASSFLLVVYVTLVTSLIVQIEYRNNTWKQVYASPRSFADIYFSKLITIHFMIAACFLLFNVFIVMCGYALGFFRHEYVFSAHPLPLSDMALTTAKMYVSVLAMTALQYWLSLRSRNFIFSLGVGFALFITGLMIRQWEYIYYYPYMFPFLIYFKNPGLAADTAHHATVNSWIYSVLITVFGFSDTALRKEKG